MDAPARVGNFSRFEQLRYGRDIVRLEGQTLISLADRLGEDFCEAAEALFACKGNVLVTGMGKAGLVGQKIAATMASTGTNAHFLHPGEAVHGDLGRIRARDAVLALSYSGETEEIVRLLPNIQALHVPIIAITGRPQSVLASKSTVVVDLGPLREACALGLAPSTSTTAMLAVGDALALVLSRMRDFRTEDFARFHPAGSLGRKLARVDDLMRPLAECRMAQQSASVREVFVQCSRPGRRSGAIMIIDSNERLQGIFTDSDLARLLERKQDAAIDQPIEVVMTRSPTTITTGTIIADAVAVLAERRISELPVVDADGRPLGVLDITDVISLMPREPSQFTEPASLEQTTQAEEPASTGPLRTVRFRKRRSQANHDRNRP